MGWEEKWKVSKEQKEIEMKNMSKLKIPIYSLMAE